MCGVASPDEVHRHHHEDGESPHPVEAGEMSGQSVAGLLIHATHLSVGARWLKADR